MDPCQKNHTKKYCLKCPQILFTFIFNTINIFIGFYQNTKDWFGVTFYMPLQSELFRNITSNKNINIRTVTNITSRSSVFANTITSTPNNFPYPYYLQFRYPFPLPLNYLQH